MATERELLPGGHAPAGAGDEEAGMLLVRLAVAPVKVLWVTAVTAARAGWWAARVPVRVTARTGRIVGAKAVVFFGAGLAVGLFFAPGPGAELRAQIRRRLEGHGLTDDELAEKVGFELSHAPRTWHLPQPEVAVLNGRVELTGSVPHETGRDELARVAASIHGVAEVENHVVVDDPGDA